MKNRKFKILGKNIISTIDHDIMCLKFSENRTNGHINMICATNQPELLINGTYSAKLLLKILNNNKNLSDSFVFYNDSKNVIGTLSIVYRGGNDIEYKIRNVDAFMISVLVLPEYRGQGYVAEMINMTMDYLHNKGIDEVYLAVSTNNTSAIKAYKKVGFFTVKHTNFVRVLRLNIPYRVL